MEEPEKRKLREITRGMQTKRITSRDKSHDRKQFDVEMATKRDEVLLCQEFKLYPKQNVIYTVTVTRAGVWYHPRTNANSYCDAKCVQFSDIIGCRCQKTVDSSSAFIKIFSYPFKKPLFRSKRSRRRIVVIFEVNLSSDFSSNLQVAETWRNVINCLARNLPVNKEDVGVFAPPAPGKLLMLVNPFSGPGKALQIFRNEIQPMLEEAEIPFKMQVTEYAGHAHKIVQNLILKEWYGIVIVSGDGLIYEVINGLMQRPDWEQAIRFPVGCLPGGSGNALCCSINYSAGEPVDLHIVLHSTFILIKHRIIPMDLVFVQTPSSRIFSFLSVTWGMMADIDYESEKYRAIGEARFTVGALKRIMNLRTYKGRFSFLPVAEYKPKVNNSNRSIVSKIRRFSWRSSRSTLNLTNVDDQSHSYQEFPSGLIRQTSSDQDLIPSRTRAVSENRTQENGFLPNLKEESPHQMSPARSEPNLSKSKSSGSNQLTRNDLDAMLVVENSLAGDNGTVEGNTNQNEISNEDDAGATDGRLDSVVWKLDKITASASREDFEIETETALAPKSSIGSVSCPLLPPLDQPVPGNWVTIDDSFIFVSVVYQTHLGSDMLAAPHAHLSDGFMYLVFAREGLSKSALLSLLMTFGDGGHIDSPNVEIVKALAFRIEPITEEGNMMVDGEKVECGPIQGQILPHLSRIMAMQ
ncbi:sphingosine kinase 2-like [Gigantopelta aegis]|uniref:sphingosine kinase 2-like n=1 Tax=Gigantopelta aegis TaxID=1735272 RepID=UPI001B8881DE|nr:sphingosine kinase 2-like [Gigantopelta aegis]